jgi:hypothetical protein
MPTDTKQTPPKSPLRNLYQTPPVAVPATVTTAPPKPSLRSLAHRSVGDGGKTGDAMERDYLLLDRSGSMSDKWEEALAAINTYARTLGSRVNTRIMLATFNHEYDVVRRESHPLQWRSVTAEEFEAEGSTALNDAIGRLVPAAKADNPTKATIVIMTDGEENASVEWCDAGAKALLDECRARGWQVIFLGMGHDNAELAEHYGADPNQTIAADKQSLATTLRNTAEKRATYSPDRHGDHVQQHRQAGRGPQATDQVTDRRAVECVAPGMFPPGLFIFYLVSNFIKLTYRRACH